MRTCVTYNAKAIVVYKAGHTSPSSLKSLAQNIFFKAVTELSDSSVNTEKHTSINGIFLPRYQSTCVHLKYLENIPLGYSGYVLVLASGVSLPLWLWEEKMSIPLWQSEIKY